MTERNLEIFIAAAELGKMSAAANKLFITQSSVSQAISQIEKEYGVTLFERLSHGLFLTDTGVELLNYARRLFSVKSDMEAFLNNSGETRRLRIGATITVGTCVISPVLKRLKNADPNLEADVIVENTRELEYRLLKNEIDIGLVEGKIKSLELISKNIIPDNLVLAYSVDHRFYGKTSVEARELAGENFILRESGSGTRLQFESQMQNLHIPINICWDCCSSEAIRNAVIEGHGITVISERLVRDDYLKNRLGICDISGLDLKRYFSVVYHKDKIVTRSMEEFVQACADFDVSR